MVNFTPEGLFSGFLDAFAAYSPPPAGTQSPALWGSEEHVRELFADRVDFVELTRRSYVEGAPTPRDYVELFKQTFGPVVALYGSLADDPGRSAALDRDFLEFATHADSGPSGGPAEYRYEYPARAGATSVGALERGLSSSAMAPKDQPDADLFREAEPLLPIARALKESIDEKLVGTGTGAGSPIDVDAAWDAAVRSVAEAIISERLGELDTERVLRLYADTVDDEALKATLGSWAAAKAEELERERRIEGLRADCARSGAIELARLEADTLIRLGLFERRQISQAHRESSLPPSRTTSLRLVDPERGYAEVIADTALGPSTRDLFAPQARGRIGSTIVEEGKEWLEPRLQVHAPLGYDFGDGPTRTNEVIG